MKKYRNSEWKRSLKYLSKILLKAKHFNIYAVFMQCAKLAFMIRNLEKKRSNGIELLQFSMEKVLKKYR